jgi:fibronectin type 3 domain-containing protein
MKHWKSAGSWIMCMLVLSIISLVAGCGGGGGGGGVSSSVVSGVAAAGSPLSGSVNLKDSSTTPQVKTAVIDGNGNYAIDVTGLTAPFIIEATGTVGSNSYTFCSFAGGPGTANVNPLTNLIVADAAGVNDPTTLYQNPNSTLLQQVGNNLSNSVTKTQTALQPLLSRYGANTLNPLSGPCPANHTGLDLMFDQVSITLSNGNVTITNIGMPGAAAGAVFLNAAPMTGMHGWMMSNLPPVPTVPAAPTGVAATGGSQQVTVSWAAVSGATSYNIYWSTTSGVTKATGTKITGASTPYIHSGLSASTTYYYIVTAVNGAGESAPSVQASATTAAPVPTIPAAPTGVTATPGTNQVTLSWSAASGASSYNIYWSTTSGVTIANGTKIANVTSPAVHSGLNASTSYHYIVTAVNSAGESSPSAQVSATTLPPTPSVPSAPTGVIATGGSKQVNITWTAVSGATSYNIYWSTTSGVTTANGTKIAGVTSPYVHIGLADSTTYYYIVSAVNGAGESTASVQTSATTSAPSLTCGTCHAIPPATGQHNFHVNSLGFSCSACHGSGYSSTTVNSATHMNGSVDLLSSVGFNKGAGTCSTLNCHGGSRAW